METNRQKKFANLLLQEFSEIFRKQANNTLKGKLLSVTEVSVTSDLSIAKIYISIFPSEGQDEIMEGIVENTPLYRKELGSIIGKQVRIIPNLIFYLDQSMERAAKIDEELKNGADNIIL